MNKINITLIILIKKKKFLTHGMAFLILIVLISTKINLNGIIKEPEVLGIRI